MPRQGRKRMPSFKSSMLIVLTIAVGVIAGRVECVNAMAGNRLPRTHPLDVGKWRTMGMNESRWKRMYGPRDTEGHPVARPLTDGERRQMDQDIARMNAESSLRDWVGGVGLLQYILLPALVIMLLQALAHQPKRAKLVQLIPTIAVVLFAAASLWHRGYLSSLEW